MTIESVYLRCPVCGHDCFDAEMSKDGKHWSYVRCSLCNHSLVDVFENLYVKGEVADDN